MKEKTGGRFPFGSGKYSLFPRAALQAPPVDIVTVMLGGNDLLQNKTFTAEDVTSRMEGFLRELKANILDVRLLLIAPPPRSVGQ